MIIYFWKCTSKDKSLLDVIVEKKYLVEFYTVKPEVSGGEE